jgi:biopolymer transport protein ExbD
MSKRAHAPHEFELNLTPIIDCFVTLICFLLLSATYVSLVGLEAKVPLAVLASQAAKEDNTPKFKLDLNVTAKGMELTATAAGSASGKKVLPNINGKNDIAGLHALLVKVKGERPKELSIHFTSAIDMPYEDLVHLMDTSRNLDPKDGTFAVTDERNGHTVKMDVLFPDFVMDGLAARSGK